MIGAEHCSVTGHATRDELEKVRQNAAAWGRHFSELVDKIGLTNEFSSLKSVINR